MDSESIRQDKVDEIMNGLMKHIEGEHPWVSYKYHPFTRTMTLLLDAHKTVFVEGVFVESGELEFKLTIQGRTGSFYPESVISIVESILKNRSK